MTTHPKRATGKRTYTLSNDFHSTHATFRAIGLMHIWDEIEIQSISKAQAARLKRTLCGNRECTCGGAFGERGSQWAEHQGRRVHLVLPPWAD